MFKETSLDEFDALLEWSEKTQSFGSQQKSTLGEELEIILLSEKFSKTWVRLMNVDGKQQFFVPKR